LAYRILVVDIIIDVITCCMLFVIIAKSRRSRMLHFLPKDSCKFPTEESMGAQNLNFVPKHKMGVFSSNICISGEMFPIIKKNLLTAETAEVI